MGLIFLMSNNIIHQHKHNADNAL